MAEHEPYVGPCPFGPEDEHRFFGRDREVTEVVSRILARSAILLYSTSGAGKSSLIEAGLRPRLANVEECEILRTARVSGPDPVTVTNSTFTLDEKTNLFVFHTLLSWCGPIVDPAALTGLSISRFLKELPRDVVRAEAEAREDDPDPRPRIAFFDQFEELFQFYPGRDVMRREFFRQIRDAMNDDPALHVVFAMREEFVAELDPYLSYFPDRLRTRSRLEGLSESQAYEAVVKPLEGTGRSYGAGVAEKLVKNLIMGQRVEPVQLQVLCHVLWNKLDPQTRVIGHDELRLADVNTAFSQYYEDCIAVAVRETNANEAALRRWFRDALITPRGNRGLVYLDGETHDAQGVPEIVVRVLEQRYLIRPELRSGERWYELTHDRLIAPIRSSNEKYFATRLEAERDRTVAERDKMRKSFQQFRISAGLVALSLAILCAWLYREYQNADAAKRQVGAASIAAQLKTHADYAKDKNPRLAMLLLLEAYEREPNEMTKQEKLPKSIESLIPWIHTPVHQLNNVSEILGVPRTDSLFIIPSQLTESGKIRVVVQQLTENGQWRQSGLLSPVDELVRKPDPKGEYFVSQSPPGTANEEMASLTVWNKKNWQDSRVFPCGGTISSLNFSDGSEILAVVTMGAKPGENIVHFGNREQGFQLSEKFKPDADVQNFVFGPAGRVFAVLNGAGVANIFRKGNDGKWKCESVLPHPLPVIDPTFSPKGELLVTIFSADGEPRHENTIFVWAGGPKWTRIQAANNHFRSKHPWRFVEFSASGRYLAAILEDSKGGRIRIWDRMNDWKLVPSLSDSRVILSVGRRKNAMAFSPKGERLAYLTEGNIVRIYDGDDGWKEAMVLRHDRDIRQLVFSADGEFLFTVDVDDVARSWRWKPRNSREDIVQTACRILAEVHGKDGMQNLTQGEWKRYLKNEEYRKTVDYLLKK